MLTRRTMSKGNSAPTIKPLSDYLKEQSNLLDNIERVLQMEHRAIKERKIESLEGIAEEKSSLMLQLQANDQRLKLHPEASLLKTEYAQDVAYLKEKLAKCKEINEVNGKLISLCLAANRRLTSVLMGARDKLSRNMTYTEKGNTVATGPLRVNINA